MNVNYAVPVLARGISTGGGSGPTASDIVTGILAGAQITPIRANMAQINGTTLTGHGVPGDEFGAA